MPSRKEPTIKRYVDPPRLKRLLRFGMSGDDVKAAQELLQAQGFFDGTPQGNYRELTRASVIYFQGTHLGEDGLFLKPDGVLGPATWWALHNPSGEAQRSFIEAPDDSKLESEPRLKVLQYFRDIYREGIREIPDGSNYGDGVTAIVNACGYDRGIAWCMAIQSAAEKVVYGEAPLGAMHVSCARFWNEATKWGRAFPKEAYRPIPGDIGIFIYGTRKKGPNGGIQLSGPGHAVRVDQVSADGRSFNTFGGNEGNRLKYALRRTKEESLVGFVNLFEDEDNRPQFKPGVTHAPEVIMTLADTR